MRIRALMGLHESPLRPKVQHTRSTLMSKHILNKAKVPRRAYIMTVGKWLRYGIKVKTGPPVLVPLRGGLQPFVRTVTWKYIPMEVDVSNAVIADIKEYIQGYTGIPMERQKLVLYGKGLNDGRRLADCDVREGSTLDLVIRR